MGRANWRVSLAVFFCSSFLLNLQLWAQTPTKTTENVQPDGSPTFTSNSHLVLVPVMVKAKNGEHISGLGRDAFKVEEQGKPRTVATFEEVRPVAPMGKAQLVPPLEGRSNFNFEDAPRGHLTIVVLDLLNTPYLYLGDGKKKLIDELARALPANEATAVFGLGTHGLKQLYSPTADTAGLLASLRGLGGAPPPVASAAPTTGVDALSNAEFQNLLREATSGTGLSGRQSGLQLSGDLQDSAWTTLTSMTQIAQAYKTIPGRKTLIWASAGLNPRASRTSLLSKMEETWRELNAADISVYSVDVSGLAPFNGTLTGYGELGLRERSLRDFSNETGGLWCKGTSIDIDKCLSRAFADAGSYYLLGYYLPSDDQKPGWRKLKVKVTTEGAHVRAREGFYVTAGADEKADDKLRELLDALRSPVELTGVRINVREVRAAAAVKAQAGTSRHEFAVGVLGDSIAMDEKRGNAVNVSVTAVAFASDGREHGRIDHLLKANVPENMVAKFRKTGMSTQQGMDLAPGRYEIHFAVRDNFTGEIGTVNYPLVVK